MEDGEVFKLYEKNVMGNTKKFQNSLVVKIFGDNISSYVISTELKRQWFHFWKFNLTWLGKGWMLCAFDNEEGFDLVLSN